jgi:DDE superfamily endonuclease
MRKGSKHAYCTGLENCEMVTIIEYIYTNGTALQPMIIYKGQQIQSGWRDPENPFEAHIAVSPNGWTDAELATSWSDPYSFQLFNIYLEQSYFYWMATLPMSV